MPAGFGAGMYREKKTGLSMNLPIAGKIDHNGIRSDFMMAL
jgi:hypothetical protein